jgi:hypothetical protein
VGQSCWCSWVWGPCCWVRARAEGIGIARTGWGITGALDSGKRELPLLARVAGRGVGKLVNFLNLAGEYVSRFGKEFQVGQVSVLCCPTSCAIGITAVTAVWCSVFQLQDEVRQNMYQLSAIRSELRHAGMSTLGTRPHNSAKGAQVAGTARRSM